MSRGVDDATAGMYLYGVLREEELPLSGHERTELVHLCTVGSFQGTTRSQMWSMRTIMAAAISPTPRRP